jgi:hypothetical protein
VTYLAAALNQMLSRNLATPFADVSVLLEAADEDELPSAVTTLQYLSANLSIASRAWCLRTRSPKASFAIVRKPMEISILQSERAEFTTTS